MIFTIRFANIYTILKLILPLGAMHIIIAFSPQKTHTQFI